MFVSSQEDQVMDATSSSHAAELGRNSYRAQLIKTRTLVGYVLQASFFEKGSRKN